MQKAACQGISIRDSRPVGYEMRCIPSAKQITSNVLPKSFCLEEWHERRGVAAALGKELIGVLKSVHASDLTAGMRTRRL